jgi:cytidylate kinase
LQGRNIECDIEVIEKDIIDRDYRDMHRENSPLMQAEDAVLVDSSDMNAEEVATHIIRLFKEKIKE